MTMLTLEYLIDKQLDRLGIKNSLWCQFEHDGTITLTSDQGSVRMTEPEAEQVLRKLELA